MVGGSLTEKPVLTQLLKINAGLDEQAALVYRYILIVGSLTIGEVTEYTGLSYEVASRALDDLTDKKLVRKLAHVVNRYVPVAPYRAFAELLVEFQREMKELEENARKSIGSALAEISKTNEKWKSDAIKLRDEQVSQVKQDIHLLREEAGNARKTLVENLRRETEARKSTLTDLLRRHLDEHTATITDVEKEVNLKVDSSVAKFAETAAKLKEQVSQTSASYLGKFDERMRLFLTMIGDNLAALGSDFTSSVEKFDLQTSGFLEDCRVRIRDLVGSVKTRTNDLIHEVEQSFTQLSSELQKTASNNVDSSIGVMSATNKDLELNLTNVIRIHGEKLTEAIISHQGKTREAIGGWKAAAKGEVQNKLALLTESIGEHADNLSQKMESTKTPINELLKSHLASADAASTDLGSNIENLTETFKRDIGSKAGAPGIGIRESCDAAAKDCISLVTALEALSKRNVPLTSKTIADFTSEVNGKLSKMTASFVANAKSFAADVKESMLGTLSDVLDAYRSSGAPAETSKKGSEAQTRASAMKKDITKKIDEATSAYVDEIKESTGALDRYASEKMSATLGFEKELAKKWDAITVTLKEISELAEAIKAFPQAFEKVVNEVVSHYSKKTEGVIATTKRLLTVHSTTLGDAISSTMKKWTSTVEKSKKEIADISTARREELSGLVTKQVETIEKITADQEKALADLISQKIESIKSADLTSRNTIAKQVGSNTEKIKISLKDIEEKMKSGLRDHREEFKAAIEQKLKENIELSNNMIGKTDGSIEELKQQLGSMIAAQTVQVKQICESINARIRDTSLEQSKELHEIVSSGARSFDEIISTASEVYKKEGESIKGLITSVLSQHLKTYANSVGRAISEIDATFAKHFEDCKEFTEKFGIKLEELLTTHQEKYERASTKLIEGLANCIDQDETAINTTSKKMLKEFTDNTTKTSKEAGSVENLMRTAWAEVVDTQQINADKTWHYVTKQAVLNHIRDMVRRTKSTVTIVVPNIEEAPIKEIKEISKAIRINVIAGIDETFHRKLLKELFSQGNVRLWSLAEKDYISCTRDAEEVLIAPAARKDTDCVATVSTEENYVKLYHKFIGPMWMASSREIKEKTLG